MQYKLTKSCSSFYIGKLRFTWFKLPNLSVWNFCLYEYDPFTWTWELGLLEIGWRT